MIKFERISRLEWLESETDQSDRVNTVRVSFIPGTKINQTLKELKNRRPTDVNDVAESVRDTQVIELLC